MSSEKRAWNAQFSRRECCILIAHLSLLPRVDGVVRRDAFFLFLNYVTPGPSSPDVT